MEISETEHGFQPLGPMPTTQPPRKRGLDLHECRGTGPSAAQPSEGAGRDRPLAAGRQGSGGRQLALTWHMDSNCRCSLCLLMYRHKQHKVDVSYWPTELPVAG